MSERIAHIAKEAKLKTKRILHVDNSREELNHDDSTQSRIEDNAGFIPSKTGNVEHSMSSVLKAQMPKNMSHLAHMVRHPRSGAIQNWTEDSIALEEEPYISREDDEVLVEAVEELEQAEHAEENDESVPDGLVPLLRSRVEGMEDDRERKRVAWITSKYIEDAMVIKQGSTRFPLLSSYRWVTEDGEPQGEYWMQWLREIPNLARRLTRPPVVDGKEKDDSKWDREGFLQEVERVIMASAPVQKWFSRLSKLGSWEDPGRSGAWFALWLMLWGTNCVFRFVFCYVGYIVVTNRSKREDRDRIRQSQGRAGDGGEIVDTIGEKIRRHGSEGWVEPAFELIVPALHPYVKLTADCMEILDNFRDWKTTRATISILLVLTSLIVLGTLASFDTCVRLSTLSAILGFFLHRPIFVRYPGYLFVLLPAPWIFWDVPTHMETSFQYLRRQADEILEPALTNPSKTISKTSADGLENIFIARCDWQSVKGHMILGSDHIRFVKRFPKEEQWRRPLAELREIQKGKEQTSIIKTTRNFIKLTFVDGSTEVLAELKRKDEIFNVIVAFSGLAWKQL